MTTDYLSALIPGGGRPERTSAGASSRENMRRARPPSSTRAVLSAGCMQAGSLRVDGVRWVGRLPAAARRRRRGEGGAALEGERVPGTTPFGRGEVRRRSSEIGRARATASSDEIASEIVRGGAEGGREGLTSGDGAGAYRLVPSPSSAPLPPPPSPGPRPAPPPRGLRLIVGWADRGRCGRLAAGGDDAPSWEPKTAPSSAHWAARGRCGGLRDAWSVGAPETALPVGALLIGLAAAGGGGGGRGRIGPWGGQIASPEISRP